MDDAGLIVIGSGPGGVSAAQAYREAEPDAPVRILTADEHPPYERPPLSKDYLRGDTDDVWLHPSEWYGEQSIDLLLNAEVQSIDLVARTVTAGDEVHPYASLIVACGAGPTPFTVPGGEHALQLRSLADANRLRERVIGADSAVIIGAGFIGCEVAASLALRGMAVTVVAPDHAPQEKRLGAAAGERLRELVTTTGVHFVGGVSVRELSEGVVHLDDGTSIDCDVIIAATGVTPRSELAEKAGLEVRDGRVVVGSDMRASAPDVYAVGDVALAHHDVVGRHIAVEHWQDADDQGSIAGANAAGGQASWSAVPGFWSSIGEATVKYHAWGDGYESEQLVSRPDGFVVWYESAGAAVGVLTHEADDDYDLGETLIADARPAPVMTD